jgi:hypothetical protein
MPFDIPTFNSINDRQYIRPTYIDPMTGGITYNNPMNTPQAQAPMPTPSYGNMPTGGDFFSQLAGLFGGMQQAAQQRPMSLSERLMEARRMPSPTGYGYDGGNRPLEQETRMRGALDRRASGMGQFGQASGGRRPSSQSPAMPPRGPAAAPGLLPNPNQQPAGGKPPSRFGTPSQVYDPREYSGFRNRFGGTL